MPTEIDDQLTMYFDWIERETGFGLRRSTRSAPSALPTSAGYPTEISVGSTEDRHPRPSRFRLAAAVSVAAAVVAGLLLINMRSNTEPVTPAATDASDPIASTTAVEAPIAGPTVLANPSATSTPSSVTSTEAAKPIIENLAFGESVMQAVQNVLPQHGVNVDAQESIQASGIIDNLRATRETYDITSAVIIQSGTNGPVTAAQYDEMADILADLPHVYFLTIKAPLEWVPDNNARIRALPATHPNVTVIDWEALAAQLGPDDLSKADGGVHLNSGTAVRFYSNMILGALGKPLIPDP